MPDEPQQHPEEIPPESDERFPSGPWQGFWLQRPLACRQWMRDLHLHFADGKVSGWGCDWVGPFTFDGSYELNTGIVRLHKSYLGGHIVDYAGQNENDGQWLWGVWTISFNADRGGFHLWPKGVDDPTTPRLAAEVEQPEEEAIPLSIP